MAKTKKPLPAGKVQANAGITHVITVIKQPAKAYRQGSARANYWHVVNQHNGKTVAQLAQAVTNNPPSMPTKGKLANKLEPLAGWLGFFVRQGLITITTK